MKQYVTILLFVGLIVSMLNVSCQNDNTKHDLSLYKIIPFPVEIHPRIGYFKITSDARIITQIGNTAVDSVTSQLTRILGSFGLSVKTGYAAKNKGSGIFLTLNTERNETLGKKGYELKVSRQGIDITANESAGLLYGVQTLRQLLPLNTHDGAISGKADVLVPCVDIIDYPRFAWRGMLMDVAHHFFPIASVKRFIDEMAMYKYNTLQLHMTNDNAWRIEIKAFPRLTEIGGWRVPRTGLWGSFEQPKPGEKATDGGFYTQEELKELVKYAQSRQVTILPGIEMPGHALALIASYPFASCTGKQYDVNPGCPRSIDIAYNVCPGNDDVFEIMDKILTEYTGIFPSEYIHIGGDEVDKHFWKTCLKCRQRMKEENLQNVEELQSYFIKRIEKLLNAKGKKLVGWDEILEGGLAPGATVMSWRGMDGGIKAAQAKHPVVMSPTQYCYFDYAQTDRKIVGQSKNYGLLRISRVYEFEPVPDDVETQYILGGQGNLWSEFIPTFRQNEYQAWPRGMALSEVLWSPKSERNTDEFLSRVEAQFPLLERENINYARSMYDPIITPVKDTDGNMQIMFSSEMKGLDIYYSFNYTRPDNFSSKFTQKPVDVPTGATQVWAITYRNGKPIGDMLMIGIDELVRRMDH